MATKPKVVAHMFGPFMVANRKWGKMVPPYFSIGTKQYPVDSCDLDVEVGRDQTRMTATRILAGGVLLGPVGMILGGMARKDITKGRITLTVNGDVVQAYDFPARDLDQATALIQALTDAQTPR